MPRRRTTRNKSKRPEPTVPSGDEGANIDVECRQEKVKTLIQDFENEGCCLGSVCHCTQCVVIFYLRRRRRLCFWCSLFVCLSVCLSIGLLANLWTDFDDIFWRGRAWLKDQVIQFWWRSRSHFRSGTPKSEIRILQIGGGLCSLNIFLVGNKITVRVTLVLGISEYWVTHQCWLVSLSTDTHFSNTR